MKRNKSRVNGRESGHERLLIIRYRVYPLPGYWLIHDTVTEFQWPVA